MPITINGSGTVTGISAGGLPDDCITTADIAAGAVTQAKRSEQLTLDTAKTATGTFVDFTGIPSWVKRVTVMFNGVSTNGTSPYQVQIGSGSFTVTGYAGKCIETTAGSGTGFTAYTAGFIVARTVSAAMTLYGKVELTLVTGNTWLASGVTLSSATDNQFYFSGSLALAGTLDRIRITTVNGTDTFDGGTINIMYE